MQRRHLLQSLPVLASGLSLPSARAAAAPRARLRSAICAYSYRDPLAARTMTYEDLVRLAVENDVDGLDLTVYWFPNTSDAFLHPLRRLAYKNAVEIYSISVRTVMTQPTPGLRAGELAVLREWVDVAEKLGAGHIRVFGGNVPKGTSEDQAAAWVVEILKQAADYAGSKGIILGLENHGGITERAARIIDIVKKVDSPWVGINLDTGNFNRDVFRQIEQCLPHAVNVQVKEEMVTADGKRARQDWDHVVRMLVAGGYRGYLALEYELKNPEAAMPGLLKELNATIRKHST